MKASRFVLLFVPLLGCASALAEYEPIDITPIRGKISIRLHQKFTVLFDQRGNRPVNPRRINTATKQPVVMAEFLEGKRTRILKIESTFPRMVRYRAAARGEGRSDWHRVNRMFGLLPKVANYEGFPGPIEEFVLYDFTLTNEKLDQTSTNETIGW
jgi:hypothetical protein